jgi:hypothetical protein
MRLQETSLKDLPPANHCTLQISLDETEVKCRIKKETAVYHVMMLHGRLTRWRDGHEHPDRYDLIMAPAIVSSIASPCLLAALLKRLPLKFSELKAQTKTLTIAFVSDAAKSCCKLGRHFRALTSLDQNLDGVLGLHAVCLQHQLHLAVSSVLRRSDIVMPMFCGSVLLHYARVLCHLRNKLHKHIREQLEITFDAPPAENQPYLESVLRLLEPDHLLQGSSEGSRQRARRRHQVAEHLAASKFERGMIVQLRHYCPLGCCSSRQEAIDKVVQDLDTVLMPGLPMTFVTFIPTASPLFAISLQVSLSPSRGEQSCEGYERHRPKEHPTFRRAIAGPNCTVLSRSGRWHSCSASFPVAWWRSQVHT